MIFRCATASSEAAPLLVVPSLTARILVIRFPVAPILVVPFLCKNLTRLLGVDVRLLFAQVTRQINFYWPSSFELRGEIRYFAYSLGRRLILAVTNDGGNDTRQVMHKTHFLFVLRRIRQTDLQVLVRQPLQNALQ